MDFAKILYFIGTSFLAWLLFTFIYELFFSPLRHIPGPFLARFTNSWYLSRTYLGSAEHDTIALHRKYAKPGECFAPIVRLAPKMYSITSPAKSVYGVQTKATKSSWYDAWKHPSPERWTLFPLKDIKLHAEVRRKFQGLYSMTSLISYEGYVDDCVELMLARLRKIATKDLSTGAKIVDLANLFQCYAFDVVGAITYGTRFGFLDEGKDTKTIFAGLDSAFKYSALAGLYTWVHPYLYGIMEKLPGNGAASRNMVVGFAMQELGKKEAQGPNEASEKEENTESENLPEDFVSKMLKLQRGGEKGVSRYHIVMMSIGNIFAGSDTLAVTLSALIYHFIRSPRVLRELREEIHRVKGAQGISPDRKDGSLLFATTQAMPYLQACIKEALRLHSAVGLPLWRESPSGGLSVGEQYFPAGVDVGVNPWVPHYNTDVWGDDAAEFRPERWIEAEAKDGEELKEMEHNFVPWGLGSRTCIGKNIAMLEMSKLVPRIVDEFDFERVSTDRNWATANHWFVKPTDFVVRIKETST